MIKHQEIKTIEHKGIKVVVEINYDRNTVSLVEPIMHSYEKKHWVFAERGLEYMNGWLDIIEAMKVAVLEAKADLEHDLAVKSSFKKQEEISKMKIVHRAVKELSKKPRK